MPNSITANSDLPSFINQLKNPIYLTATSADFAFSSVGVNLNYGLLSNNSVTLTPGQWTVSGYFVLFTGTAGNGCGLTQRSGFYASNGANSGTAPTALSGVLGNTSWAYNTTSAYSLGIIANTNFHTSTLSFDITILANTTIFLVPQLVFSTASNAAVTAAISARRNWTF